MNLLSFAIFYGDNIALVLYYTHRKQKMIAYLNIISVRICITQLITHPELTFNSGIRKLYHT